MKIALFSEVYTQLSGVSTHVRSLAALLSKKHDVTLYTGSGKSKGFKIVNLSKVSFPLAEGYEIIIPKRIRVDADIVHVHTPYTLGLMALKQKKPLVATTHTTPKNLFSAYHLNFLDPIGWKYLIYFYNSANHIICQTKETEKLFRNHGLNRPVSIISSGVDFNFFSKGKVNKIRKKYDLEKKFVLSTSRISREKRPELILKACRDLNIPLVMASNGPLKEKLEKKYPEARFLGYVPDKDMPGLYASSTIFALASEPGAEGEGLVLLEAMAAKKPVIASRVSPITEFIHDGENGFLFKDYADFKKKLKKLWRDKRIRNKFSRRGKKSAKEKDIKKVAEKISNIYESLLGLGP